jgi:hypothetical protein
MMGRVIHPSKGLVMLKHPGSVLSRKRFHHRYVGLTLIPALLGAGIIGLAAAPPATAAVAEVSAAPSSTSGQDAPDGLLNVAYDAQYANPAYPGLTDWQLYLADGTLPDGLTLNRVTGRITGTPQKAGTFHFYVLANAPGYGQGFPDDITIASAPTKITNYAPSMFVNTPYSFKYEANGFPTPDFSIDPTSNGTLPPGITLSSDGTLSGTPTTPGYYKFKILATNSAGSVGRIEQFYVNAPPTIDGTPTEATVGAPYAFSFSTSGFPAPSVALTPSNAFPQGLSFDPSNARITGTPAAAGQSNFTVTASVSSQWDGYTASQTKSELLTVQPAIGGQALVTEPPASVQPGAWENDSNIRVFGERYNTELTTALTIGGKVIPAGTKVNSYYVHADPVGSANVNREYTGSISFGSQILAIAASTADLQATAAQFGKPGVTYSTSTDQGLEYNDSATTGTTVGKVNLDFNAYNTSDAVRVITLAP